MRFSPTSAREEAHSGKAPRRGILAFLLLYESVACFYFFDLLDLPEKMQAHRAQFWIVLALGPVVALVVGLCIPPSSRPGEPAAPLEEYVRHGKRLIVLGVFLLAAFFWWSWWDGRPPGRTAANTSPPADSSTRAETPIIVYPTSTIASRARGESLVPHLEGELLTLSYVETMEHRTVRLRDPHGHPLTVRREGSERFQVQEGRDTFRIEPGSDVSQLLESIVESGYNDTVARCARVLRDALSHPGARVTSRGSGMYDVAWENLRFSVAGGTGGSGRIHRLYVWEDNRLVLQLEGGPAPGDRGFRGTEGLATALLDRVAGR
jgi:hypothetical protein